MLKRFFTIEKLKWLIIFIGLIVLDQVSKFLVSTNMQEFESIPVINNFFAITYSRNSGMVFGALEGAASANFWILLIFAVVASGIFGYLFFKSDFKDKRLWIYRLALILLISGSIGNGIDRAIQPDHSVIDFLDFHGIWVYIFNLADSFLVVGIGLFFIDTFIL